MMKSTQNQMLAWSGWLALNVSILGYFGYGLLAPASAIKESLLPGQTTHGHYQIELDCNACHQAETDASHSASNVMQDACNRCHEEQLELANDTHPATKFNDPTNADRLLILDAQNCLTCHREHVPDRTLASGLTVPVDYCWHCHQEVADSRPSHEGMAFDSCATAGCHNYHDNRALYEKYLNEHHGEPDYLDIARQPQRNLKARWLQDHPDAVALTSGQHDAPSESVKDATLLSDWAETAHAAAGVNCTHCHENPGDTATESDKNPWSDTVSMAACESCHAQQTTTFMTGKHGMRLARDMTPMRPELARLPMHADAAHRELTCNACHPGHRFDTQFAAVEACQGCHADSHTQAYASSKHADLWKRERSGELGAGSGVTCATCHLPRRKDGKSIWVSHDQNANLRPSETMAREVCSSCHGLEFSLSALADPALAANCYDDSPAQRNESVRMAHEWFQQREAARKKRQRKGH